MPKSNFLKKKSSTGTTADFKRLKGKVGKRAPQAASHTDTSFKSKRVRVSAQSILHEAADGEAITARGQGVQELLIQLRHYSPATKREALLGLKSIVDRNPRYAEVDFARLAEGSLELSVCFDADVRKTLLMYQATLLSSVHARTFAPFANIYLAYVVSAMTSLDRAVRRDSLALLALLLDRFPSAVADRVDRLAPNYVALLALDPTSKKQIGRAEALKSLVSLFRAVSRHYGRERSPLDVGKGRDGAGKTRNASATVVRWRGGSHRNSALLLCHGRAAVAKEGNEAWRGGDSDGGDGGGCSGTSSAVVRALAAILPQVLERLREVWMEAVVADPPDITLLQDVVDVLLGALTSPAWTAAGNISDDGVGAEKQGITTARIPPAERENRGCRNRGDRGERGGSTCGSHGGPGNNLAAWLARFVMLVLEAFPIRPLESELLEDVKAERLNAIEGLNLRLCELVVAASAGPAAVRVKEMGAAHDSNDPTDWLRPVLAHVHEVLRDGMGKSIVGPQTPSVLRVVRAAMHSPTGKNGESESWTAQRRGLLSAFGDYFASLPSHAGAKLLCVEFVCSLTTTLLSSSPRTGDTAVAQEVGRWLQTFPKLLCQWEGHFPEASAMVLRMLVDVAKRSPTPSSDGNSAAIGAGPAGGKSNGREAVGAVAGAGGWVWGLESAKLLHSLQPVLLGEFFSGAGFVSLPVSAQMDAVSFLYHLPCLPACVVSTLASVCSDPTAVDGDVRSYVLEVMHHRRRTLTPSAYLSFLVSVLTGGVTPAKQSGGGKRTAARERGELIHAGSSAGDGKRRRQQSAGDGGAAVSGRQKEGPTTDATQPVVTPPPLKPAVPTLWETVFARDKVTGAVCNSLAMVGTRGSALLEALRPTLLKLLSGRRARPRVKGVGGGGSGSDGGGEGGNSRSSGVTGHAKKGSASHSADTPGDDGAEEEEQQSEQAVAVTLQGQRAAMACVLCCWEGLDSEPSFNTYLQSSPSEATKTPSTAAAAAAAAACATPLCALEQPMVLACVQAMKTAGTWTNTAATAEQKSFTARLLRPVLVLVKRWPALLPAILTRIVVIAKACAAATNSMTVAMPPASTGAAPVEVMKGAIGLRSVEPLVRCLQVMIRDAGLQGQLQKWHLGSLEATAETLCVSLDGSPLWTVVEQLRADVRLLAGGGGSGIKNRRISMKN